MKVEMSTELSYYDIFPKVIPEGKTVELTLRGLGAHAAFKPGHEYTLKVIPLDYRDHPSGLTPSKVRTFAVTAAEDCALRLNIAFEGEQCHFVRVMDGERQAVQMAVYSLKEDLCGRYPYMGDLHVHTFRSDGREAPAVVCANYRKMGFDFLAVTDHHLYYSSLEAMRAYENAPIDMMLAPGEEVHLPGNPTHVVNWGGLYSVNAMVESIRATVTRIESTLPENQPDAISDEEFRRQALEIAEKTDLPEGVDPLAYGASVWEFDRIREADGLAIFPHPYWVEGNTAFNVAPALTDYLLDTHPFDAFELLGGERYFAHNGFQNLAYQEARARGARFPVVGSSDSHGSVNNPGLATAKTIVFSPKNERKAIINSVKDFYSVAVDIISQEVRLCGEFRMVKYGHFLLENYFPLHDELCYEEGRAMKEYVCGDDPEGARELLAHLQGRTDKMLKKYFAF